MGRSSEALIGDSLYFDGSSYDASRDKVRLGGQLSNVCRVMSDHRWHTLREIADRVGGSEAAISARIRDLRKPRFGSFTIDRQHLGGGLWRYRMT